MSEEAKKISKKKVMVGKVVSDRMDKTVVVSVQRVKKHAKYQKYIKRSKRYKVHDEKNDCKIGDVVKFIETRPISKEKSWKMVSIIQKAK